SASLSSVFCRLRPPPTSPFFPYTTLFRSKTGFPEERRRGRCGRRWLARGAGAGADRSAADGQLAPRGEVAEVPGHALRRRRADRSEEHTSELQALTNLACRLLLAKKNSAA